MKSQRKSKSKQRGGECGNYTIIGEIAPEFQNMDYSKVKIVIKMVALRKRNQCVQKIQVERVKCQ